MGRLNFNDVPKFPVSHYNVNIEWSYLEDSIERYRERHGFDMDPEYQRGHVWTEQQQVDFVEYGLKGGEGGRQIITNCPGWMADFRGPYELVDGKQRIEAVRRFLRGELRVFGGYRVGEINGLNLFHCFFDWKVFNLETREEILRLYLGLNAGGTPHSKDEIDRVTAMWLKERK